MKCANCPVSEGVCHGESVSRMCRLMDPAHPDHDPRYGPVLIGMAVRPPAYPPLAQQAANLAGAFWSWAVSGFAAATHEEQGRRMDICALCEHYDSAQNRCHLCGCHLRAKIATKTAHCPLPEPKW